MSKQRETESTELYDERYKQMKTLEEWIKAGKKDIHIAYNDNGDPAYVIHPDDKPKKKDSTRPPDPQREPERLIDDDGTKKEGKTIEQIIAEGMGYYTKKLIDELKKNNKTDTKTTTADILNASKGTHEDTPPKKGGATISPEGNPAPVPNPSMLDVAKWGLRGYLMKTAGDAPPLDIRYASHVGYQSRALEQQALKESLDRGTISRELRDFQDKEDRITRANNSMPFFPTTTGNRYALSEPLAAFGTDMTNGRFDIVQEGQNPKEIRTQESNYGIGKRAFISSSGFGAFGI